MLESCEDIYENAETFKKPMLVCLAGKDKSVHNGVSKQFLKKCGVPKDDLTVKEYPDSYHNIHKEPQYKYL